MWCGSCHHKPLAARLQARSTNENNISTLFVLQRLTLSITALNLAQSQRGLIRDVMIVPHLSSCGPEARRLLYMADFYTLASDPLPSFEIVRP